MIPSLQNTPIPSGSVRPRISSTTTATSSSTSRSSLRERCGVTFQIKAIVYNHPPIVPKGPLEPRVGNLPRRRRHKSKSLVKPTPTIEVSCLQELAPGLSVAFVPDPSDGYFMKYGEQKLGALLRSSIPDHLTHVVNIITGDQSGTTYQSVDPKTGAKNLSLVVPFSTTDDGITHLTPTQLLTAREFLIAPGSLRHSAADRILITMPRDKPVDGISVAACYLAVSAGITVESILEHFNEREGDSMLGIWKGVVSRSGMEVIESAAKAE